MCLTRARDMKRRQRECQVSFVLEYTHTLPTVAVINNTAITPPRQSQRIHSAAILSGGGITGLWGLRRRQSVCV